jgi:hypothetical protein
VVRKCRDLAGYMMLSTNEAAHPSLLVPVVRIGRSTYQIQLRSPIAAFGAGL